MPLNRFLTNDEKEMYPETVWDKKRSKFCSKSAKTFHKQKLQNEVLLVATIVPILQFFLFPFGLWINAVVIVLHLVKFVDCFLASASSDITSLWPRCLRTPCCSCSWSGSWLCGSPDIIVGRMYLLFFVGFDFDCKEPEELQGEYLWKLRLATSPLAAWSFVVSPQMFPVWFDYVKHVKVRATF